jgi:hypothetical protein
LLSECKISDFSAYDQIFHYFSFHISIFFTTFATNHSQNYNLKTEDMKKGLMMMLFATMMAASATAQVPEWLKMFKLSGYGMTQYQYTGQEGAKANSFNIRLGRVIVDAKPHKDWAARVQFQYNGNTSDLSSSLKVVDVFAEWQKYDFFRVKGGQFKRAFTFENPMNPIDQGFMSYSQIIMQLAGFTDRDGMSSSNGRDLGLQIQGDFIKNKAGRNLLHYQIGVYNGQGINQKDVDQQKDVIGGIWVMPVKGMRIGAFGMEGSYARKSAEGVLVKLPQHRYAISAEYKFDDWTLRSEYIHSTGKAQFRNLTNSLRALRSKPPRMRFLLFKLAFCHVLTDMIV